MIIYKSFSDWSHSPKKALRGLAHNISCLLWSVVTGVASLFAALYRLAKSHIKTVLIVVLTITVIGLIVSHVQMKTRLTTAEHQRDKLQMKVDSIMEFNGKAGYAYSRLAR